jgi:hypothetical protein
MRARLVKFGEIEVEGKRYTHDVVLDSGKVRKRKKGPSKQFREKFGHTPLSAEEEIPVAKGPVRSRVLSADLTDCLARIFPTRDPRTLFCPRSGSRRTCTATRSDAVFSRTLRHDWLRFD